MIWKIDMRSVEGILVFLVKIAQIDFLLLRYLQMFLWVEDQSAQPWYLQAVPYEEENRGHDSSVVVGQLGGDHVRADGNHQHHQDDHIDSVVPLLGKGFGPFRKIP